MREYEVIRSARKTVSLILDRGRLIVRAPYGCPDNVIEDLIIRYGRRIEQAEERQRQRLASMPPEPDAEEIARLRAAAKEKLPPLVEKWARIMRVRPTGITITSARTRWGSCSPKDRLSFSWRLMRMPDSFIEYVVVHELAHIVHKDHSKDFWALVGKYMPDHREREKAGKI